MQSLFVIDVSRGYLPAALLTAGAYAQEGGEALLVRGSAEHDLITAAIERFRPARVYSMAGATPPLSMGGGGDDKIAVEMLPADSASLLAWISAHMLDGARGVVLFPAHSPSWAIRAAALATRLGYLIWPLEEAAGFAYAAPPDVPIIVLGEAPGALSDTLQDRPFRHLPGDRAIAQFLKESGLPVDYVVLINSADLEIPAYSGGALVSAWTQGLSLLAPLLASYRNAWVIDARSPRPEPREIERTLNQKVADAGIAPEYLALLGSPAALPYVIEPNPALGATEDLIREVHLRRNTDIFFDVAEGRIYGLTAGKASLQILTTKHYAALPGDFRKRALLLGRPQTSGVVFAIDEAVGRTQVRPLLEKAGMKVTELYGKDCAPAQIAKHLPSAGLMLYGGHGHSDSLSTHQMPLYAEALPAQIAPGIVYACACSTLYPKPTRYSDDGGFSFEEEATPVAEQIGPAFVDRGALAFVGGLSAEDVLLNTPMYVVFTQALVIKGMSVGQAVRAARNHSLLHMAIVSQASPETYTAYRIALASAIQQQALLGDPAFTPYKAVTTARLPRQVDQEEGMVRVRVSIPHTAWVRQSVTTEKGRRNEEFHRTRAMEAWLPVGEDLYNWGESYTVARDASHLSDKGVLGSYLHLSADLPAGRVPESLTLIDAAMADSECLLCGQAHEIADPVVALANYVVPFLGKEPPVRYDQTQGWAFATEETATGLRLHWLVPTLLIADAARRGMRLSTATFLVKHVPGVHVEGRLELGQGAGQGGGGGTAPGALEGTHGLLPDDLLLSFGPVRSGGKQLTVLTQALSGPGGRWSCWLPTGAEVGLKIDLPLPVHRYAVTVRPGFLPGSLLTGITAGRGPVAVPVKPADLGVLRGLVVDEVSGRPLPGAVVRIWRGRPGERPLQEYFVIEGRADSHGRFEFTLPVGGYLVETAQRTDLRYRPGKGSAMLYKGRETSLLISMEPGALVTGRVEFQGAYRPKGAKVELLEHGGKEDEVIGTGRVGRDGAFTALASTTRPFAIRLSLEGFEPLIDSNNGEGYHLTADETLERHLTVKGKARS